MKVCVMHSGGFDKHTAHSVEQKRFHQGADTSDDLNILLGEN